MEAGEWIAHSIAFIASLYAIFYSGQVETVFQEISLNIFQLKFLAIALFLEAAVISYKLGVRQK